MLVALIAALLLPAASASAAPISTGSVHGYTYDAHCGAIPTAFTSERGPPLAAALTTTDDAVDHRSHGSSARAAAAASCNFITYDMSTSLAQVNNDTGTTPQQAQRTTEISLRLSVGMLPQTAAWRACVQLALLARLRQGS